MSFFHENKHTLIISGLIVVIIALVISNLLIGAVSIPFHGVMEVLSGGEVEREAWRVIILESRIPMIVTAALTGAALAVSGLLLQTTFNNPLADPSILGVSTGASLGVAVVMLMFGGALGEVFGTVIGSYVGILVGALVGAFAILFILIVCSSIVRSATMLLIVGILFSYLASSAISLLNFFSTQQGVQAFVIWGLGNFNGVGSEQLPLFSSIIIVALVATFMMIKPLNAMLLGTTYAENLGINIKRTRNRLLIITGVLTAITTAFCGPIGFIGLVVPHMARLLLKRSNHNILLPTTILMGVVIALVCTLISVLPVTVGIIPINAITPIIGVPVILYVIFNRRRIQYFN